MFTDAFLVASNLVEKLKEFVVNHERSVRKQRQRRRFRVRKSIRGDADRPRLTVSRTLKHFYCQVIDDSNGKTLAAASTTEKDLRSQIKSGGNCDASVALGKVLAERAKAAGVSTVCFDRGSFKYHGRVAAFADAVREAGIQF